MMLRPFLFCMFGLCGLLSMPVFADLHFSAGSNFASVYTIVDPATGTPLAAGNAVYLILDVDGDGGTGDVDPQTGAVLAPDVLLSTHAIGDGAFAPFTAGGLSGQISFPDLNAALGAANQGRLYLRVFNVPNPATADITGGDVFYGDSYSSDASVISEFSLWDEVGGYFQYDRRDDDSPLQPQWTIGSVVLDTVLEVPNSPLIADAGSPQTVVDGDATGSESVTLDGSGSSDSDGTIVSYDWSRLGNPIAMGPTPTVTLPVGNHVITLVVTDNGGASATDTVSIVVEPNVLPVANAGSNQTVVDVQGDGSETVALDGSASSDADGTIALYEWQLAGTVVGTGPTPAISLPVGTHVLTLDVTDNDGGMNTDSVTIVVEGNAVPIANAGPDQIQVDGAGDGSELIALDGSASSDDSAIVSFVWTVGGSTIATGPMPMISFPVGSRVVTLTVTDDDGAEDADTVTIVVEANGQPIANAGLDQTVIDGDGDGAELVTLDGSASSDPDGTLVSFEWSLGGSLIATGVSAQVSLPVLSPGSHSVLLTVMDDQGGSDTDTVVINVLPNELPVANAGPNQTLVDVNGDGFETVSLDGSDSSDSDGTIVNYVWSDASGVIATGVTLDVSFPVGTHDLTLTVTDNDGGMGTDSVTIVIEPNGQPVANAGPDQVVVDVTNDGSQSVTLDGSASSDLDGSLVAFEWSLGAGPVATGPTPTVSLPVGTYVFQLTVTDDQGATDSDDVVIVVEGNQLPIADAGPDQSLVDADEGGDESVALDGSGSSDPDGTIVLWEWSEGGSPLAIGAQPVINLPVGTHLIDLVVTDNDGATATDQVSIVISAPNNQAPVAVAGLDQTLIDNDDNGFETVSVDAAGSSDPDGTIVSFEWSLGPTVLATTSSASFDLPIGTHTITLRVMDDDDAMDLDDLTVTILPRANLDPTADAGPDRLVVDVEGDGTEDVELDGTRSSDPDGFLVDFEWELDSSIIATGDTPTVTLPVGVHLVTLTVTDDNGDRASDDLTITVEANIPPIASAGPNQVVIDVDGDGSETVQLDGSSSGDADGSLVNIEWRDGATVISTDLSPTLNLAVGTYELDLVVTDDDGAERSDSVTVIVEPNLQPIANAGPNQTVNDADESGSEFVTLDATASSDPDGTLVSLEWFLGGTLLTSGSGPTVSLPVGVHELTLIVTDDAGASDTDTVQITVTTPNNLPPTAVAGIDQSLVDVDGDGTATVSLDGSGSTDSDGSLVSYDWTLDGTPIATGATPTITLPVGVHVVFLTVTDDDGASDLDELTITIEGNQLPIAAAGPNQELVDVENDGTEVVQLDGSSSQDPDGTLVNVEWTLDGSVVATDLAPQLTLAVGTHELILTVTDDDGAPDMDEVTIVIKGNQLPIANAGPDQTIVDLDENGTELVILDGRGSSDQDADGSVVTYEWFDGSDLIATGPQPSLTLPLGIYDFRLVVTDNDSATDDDEVRIVVSAPGNLPPVADAGSDILVVDTDASGFADVLLDGSASSDPDGTIAAVNWLENGTTIASGLTPTLMLAVGTYDVVLEVTDDDGASDTDNLTVTVVGNALPVAMAGSDQTVSDDDADGTETVRLNGSASTDDGEIIRWTWREGGTILGNGALLDVSFAVGSHTLTLTVEDNNGAEQDDTVTVNVLPNQAPVVSAGPDQSPVDSDRNGVESVSLIGSATDADGTLTRVLWELNGSTVGLGPSLTIDLPVGRSELDLVVTDNGGETTRDAVVVIVQEAPNQAPVFASYDTQLLVVGDPFVLPVQVSDPDAGQDLSFSLIDTPPNGASIDPVTGDFSWTPAPSDAGSTAVTIEVSDGVDSARLVLDIEIAEIPYINRFAGFVSGVAFQQVDFPTRSGFTYRLQHSPTLDNPSWTTVATITADNAASSLQNALPAVLQGYYRIVVE